MAANKNDSGRKSDQNSGEKTSTKSNQAKTKPLLKNKENQKRKVRSAITGQIAVRTCKVQNKKHRSSSGVFYYHYKYLR
jgi:hypothetical protein